MAEDLIKKDIYFPSNKGSNDNLISLINKTTQIISNWFSNTEKYVSFILENYIID